MTAATTEMVRGFDPYRVWLNVHEMRRPLTAYQLLNLPPKEEDIDKIREAVGRKRAAMESHRDEAPPDIWLQIQEELEEAVSIVLDPDRKAAYDMALQQSGHSQALGHASLLGGVTDKPHSAVFQCPECSAPNPATRKFCVQCGANLWEPCFECGTLCSAGERFCGACGANLASSRSECIKQFDIIFRDIEQLQAVSRFQESIALLDPIAKNDHPRLAEYSAKAKQLIRQLTAQLARRQIMADDAMQRAETRLATFDYDEAIRILESVPKPLVTDAIRELIDRTQLRRAEVDGLTAELRDAVSTNKVMDLLPKIEQLLAIKPDHAYAKELAEKVQQRLIAAAEQRLANHQYDAALKLLDRILPSVRGGRADELRQQASEMAWLMWDLRNAPVVDKTLVAAAQRLRIAAGADPKIVRLCDQVERRIQKAEAEHHPGPIAWAPAPQPTALGIAIDLPGELRRISVLEATDVSAFRREPGRFAVACGLALAGIQQAALPIDLLASQRQGVFNRVSHRIRSRVARPAWGIDVSAGSLKAVRMTWNEAAKTPRLDAAVAIEYAKPLTQASNDVEEKKLLHDALQIFLTGHPCKSDRICVGLPGRMALCRQIEVPPVDGAKLPRLVQFEAAQQFPYSLDQLAWDYHLLGAMPRAAGTSDANNRCVLLVAAQKAAIQRYLDAFRQLGVRIDALQTDVIALHNFLWHEYADVLAASSDDAMPSTVAAVDIGSDATNVVICSPQTFWFRSCSVGANNITRALVREFKLSVVQAEKLKRSPELAERFSDVNEAMLPVFEDLAGEIQQSLSAYARSPSGGPVQRLLGFGGGFSLHGLFRHLRCGR